MEPLRPLWLYRGLCPHPARPAATVTRHPWFAAPYYEVVPTTRREADRALSPPGPGAACVLHAAL